MKSTTVMGQIKGVGRLGEYTRGSSSLCNKWCKSKLRERNRQGQKYKNIDRPTGKQPNCLSNAPGHFEYLFFCVYYLMDIILVLSFLHIFFLHTRMSSTLRAGHHALTCIGITSKSSLHTKSSLTCCLSLFFSAFLFKDFFLRAKR